MLKRIFTSILLLLIFTVKCVAIDTIFNDFIYAFQLLLKNGTTARKDFDEVALVTANSNIILSVAKLNKIGNFNLLLPNVHQEHYFELLDGNIQEGSYISDTDARICHALRSYH